MDSTTIQKSNMFGAKTPLVPIKIIRETEGFLDSIDNARPIHDVLDEFFPELKQPTGAFKCPVCGESVTIDRHNRATCIGCMGRGRIKTITDIYQIKFGMKFPREAVNRIAAEQNAVVIRGRGAELQQARIHELTTASLDYIGRGWSIFPVCWMKPNGDAGCWNGGKCETPGKHPMVRNGLLAATTDKIQILEWRSQWPLANIGIRTGMESGFFGLDVDGERGTATLKRLEAEHGPLPKTLTQITGSGGYHYLFRQPGNRQTKTCAGQIGAGLDIRGAQGYIVIAPSNHKSGDLYRWVVGCGPGEIKMADPSEWLLELIDSGDRNRNGGAPGPRDGEATDFATILNGVPDGERGGKLHGYACSCLGRKNMSVPEARALTLTAARNCTPPYPEDEAIKRFESALKRHEENHPESTAPASPVKPDLETARATVAKIRENPENRGFWVKPETLGALAVVQNEDPSEWQEIRGVLAGFKPSMLREVERALKKSRLQVVGTGQRPEITVAAELAAINKFSVPCPPGIENCTMPGTYGLRDAGVIIARNTAEGLQTDILCPRLVIPVAITTDLGTGLQSVTVAFLTADAPPHWKTVSAPRADVVRGRDLVLLANRGLPVGDNDCRGAAMFISDFIRHNEHLLPHEKTVGRCGWTNDQKSFLLGKRLIPENAADQIRFLGSDAGDTQFADSLCSAGTFEGWQAAIQPIWDYPRVLAPFYASFAAPLLRILGAGTITVNNSNRTSTGKTTALRLAASVWGCPDERQATGLIRSWNTTRVHLERRAALSRDIPLLLDDSKNARFQDVEQIVYTVNSGMGRGRGSRQGIQHTSSWRTVLISNGEAPLSAYCSSDGAKARILEIRGKPLDAETEQTRKLVLTLNQAVLSHYGLAGPRFIEWLLQNRARWPEFRELWQERTRTYGTVASGIAGRQADVVALISVVGQLAHEAAILPWNFVDPFDTLWPAIVADLSEANAGKRALSDIVGWATANQASFFDGENADAKQPVTGWFGRWDSGGTDRNIYIRPEVADRKLREWGHQPDGIYAEWSEMHNVFVDSEGARYTCRRYLGNGYNRVRFIGITRAAWEHDGGSDVDESCTDVAFNRGNQVDLANF